MKKGNLYIVWSLGLALTFTACETIVPDFFDEKYNGAYFDYQYASEYETTVNFAEYIVGTPETVPVALNVKLLGRLTDETRSLSIKSKDVEGFEPAKVIIPDVVFEAQEYQKEIEILVERPEVEDETFAVCIYLDGGGDIGTGVAGKDEYIIYVKEAHEAPSIWSGHIQTYLGNWDREKHKFLANLMNDDYYYNALYDTQKEQYNLDEIIDLNGLAINTLLSEEPTEPISIDFPFLDKTNFPNYEEPYFWDSEIIGPFSLDKFDSLVKNLRVGNTSEIIPEYEKAIDETVDIIKELNKEAVQHMLNEYYSYPKSGYTIDKYKDYLWVKILKKIDYINYLRIPYWWEDPDNLGTAEVVKKYFGEYNNKKYQFMIFTMIDNEGEDNFNVASLLPFTIDTENNTFGWDETVGGETRLKECYKKIKEANDNIQLDFLKHDIPDVALD